MGKGKVMSSERGEGEDDESRKGKLSPISPRKNTRQNKSSLSGAMYMIKAYRKLNLQYHYTIF